jgi:hypothetical protein
MLPCNYVGEDHFELLDGGPCLHLVFFLLSCQSMILAVALRLHACRCCSVRICCRRCIDMTSDVSKITHILHHKAQTACPTLSLRFEKEHDDDYRYQAFATFAAALGSPLRLSACAIGHACRAGGVGRRRMMELPPGAVLTTHQQPPSMTTYFTADPHHTASPPSRSLFFNFHHDSFLLPSVTASDVNSAHYCGPFTATTLRLLLRTRQIVCMSTGGRLPACTQSRIARPLWLRVCHLCF